jgi:hypothetical protein
MTVEQVLEPADTPAKAQVDYSIRISNAGKLNQWGGLSHLPDLVAAFVQPNELAIDRLLKQTAQVLRDADKNPALNGYQGGAKRACSHPRHLGRGAARCHHGEPTDCGAVGP